MAITRGDMVQVTTAAGDFVLMRALGPPVRGRDFPVLQVCTPDDWDRAQAAGNEPDSIPWPMEAVEELASA